MTGDNCKVRLEEIRVGERCRLDLGDIDSLAKSISEVGLLHPVVISPDRTLIAGRRRLEAVRKLGWAEVPVHVVSNLEDAMRALQAEGEENACRKGFTPSEAAKLGKKLEEMEKAAAKERQAQGGQNGCGKLPEGVKGDTRDKVALALGISGRTYEKIKTVVEAAEKDPEKYRQLVEQMDKTGKVDGAYRKLDRGQDVTKAARKEDPKAMLDKLIKKVNGNQLPPTLAGLQGENGKEYATKLADLARTLNEWAKAMSSRTEEATDRTSIPIATEENVR